MALDIMYYQMNNWKNRFEDFVQQRFGANVCNDARQFGKEHPLVCSTILLALTFSAIPVVTFICFAVVTAFFSILCFIFIEGSILIFGGIILAAIISLITVLTTGMTIAFAIALWIAQAFHRLLCKQIPEPNKTPVVSEADGNEVPVSST